MSCNLDAVVSQAIASATTSTQPSARQWSFITTHAQVLLAVAENSDLLVRQIADRVEITERYVHRVLNDLERAGYVERYRRGRCNVYRVHPELTLGDRLVEEHALWELLRLVDASDVDEVVAMVARRRLARTG
jgi:DNA-binding MarR family transcriptional regulator